MALEMQTQVADCMIRIGLPCRFWCLTVLFECNVSGERVTINPGSFQITCCDAVVSEIRDKKMRLIQVSLVFMLVYVVH